MSIPNERAFLLSFIENLKGPQVRLKNQPLRALWVDQQQRTSSCMIRYYVAHPPILRVAINWEHLAGRHIPSPLSNLKKKPQAKPDWSFQLTCLHEELLDMAPWLAGIVNQREGWAKKAPAPAVELFKWCEEDFLYYKNSNMIWTQRAYNAEHNWWHRRIPTPAAKLTEVLTSY